VAGEEVRIVVGTDHGGFELKNLLIRQLKAAGHRVVDLGTFSPQPCDYPLIGSRVARAVSLGQADRGLLLCKSGGGMAIVANKFSGVRAVVCQSVALARHARQHNDSNVLVLGANQTTPKKATAILKAWLTTPFAGGRHARRVGQIAAMERRLYKRHA
jgi:ribose 5-phosphate isomerase B